MYINLLQATNKEIIVDKIPEHIFHLELLAKIYPDALFIKINR